MKRIKLLIVFILFSLAVFGQQEKPKDDLQKVKDALVNSVIYCQELEKQNASLNNLVKRIADDLKKVTTMKQLDSLKVVYGIEPKKEIKK
jgi:hypothetical protein